MKELECDVLTLMSRPFLDCHGHFDILRQFFMISISSFRFSVMNSHWDVSCGAYIETGHTPSVFLVVLKGTKGTALAFRSVWFHLVL